MGYELLVISRELGRVGAKDKMIDFWREARSEREDNNSNRVKLYCFKKKQCKVVK